MKYLSELGHLEKKDRILVSSRVVAEKFNKNHRDVLRAIKTITGGVRKIEHTPLDLLFIESTYINEQNGQKYPEFLITRDGFSLLTMGFTGEKALEWKLKYISTFNQMESALRERQTTEWKQIRQDGKLIRRGETDALAMLKVYAEEQREGKAYPHIYVNYTKLVNKAVGIGTGERLQATRKQLRVISMLEDMIEHTVDEEMKKKIFYKDIYKTCSMKVDTFMGLVYLNRPA